MKKHSVLGVSVIILLVFLIVLTVRIIPAIYTLELKTIDWRFSFRGKIPVEESPGLISVRLYVALINEACKVLMEGVGSKEDIDKTMKTGLGMSLGPFEMADKVGLDKVVRWMDNLYHEFGDIKYKASPVIKKLVRAHQFGRFSGQGFYKYNGNESAQQA